MTEPLNREGLGSSLRDTHRAPLRSVLACLALGTMAALVSMVLVWAFATDALIPRRLTCAVASADGCMGWIDKARVERFKAGKAGK